MKKAPHISYNYGVLAGALVSIALYIMLLMPFTGTLLSMFEGRLYDAKMNFTALRNYQDYYRNIVILKIDDASFEKLDMKWPWNRRIYARAIDVLSNAGARVVAFDVFFSETSARDQDAAQDSALATAINQATVPVVLAYSKNDRIIPALAATTAKSGFIENVFDFDSIVRQSMLIYKRGGAASNDFEPSWNLTVLREFLGLSTSSVTISGDHMSAAYTSSTRNGGVVTTRERLADFQLSAGENIYINYGIGEGHIRALSFHQIITGEFDPEWIRGKIVLIGATVRSLHDDFATPMMLRTKLTTPGVMIHALAQATFLENAFIYKVSDSVNFIVTILASIFLGVMIVRKTPFKAFITALVLMSAHLLATGVLFYFQVAAHSVLPQLSMILTYVFMTSYKYLKEESEKQLIKSIFKQYVTAEVVDELLESPEKLALGGKKMKVTILFLDIRNFTRLSEQLTPEAVVDLLNSFFEEMVGIVFKYDGTLDKYLGDGMMVIFGAPVDRPDNARRAVECALEMQKASIEFSRRRRVENIYTIDGIGVGVNTGEVVVGNIGSQKHKEYTIIGDNVNLAARIVSIALVNQVLISEGTYLELADKLEVKKKETVKLKGKTEPVNVYEIVQIN